jgi:hypothetical protein
VSHVQIAPKSCGFSVPGLSGALGSVGGGVTGAAAWETVCESSRFLDPQLIESSGGSSSSSRVAWTAVSSVKYLLLVTSKESSSNSTKPKFDLRITSLFDLFVEYKVSIVALQDSNSPQYVALNWMVNNDDPYLQVLPSDDQLVERFVVVLLGCRDSS